MMAYRVVQVSNRNNAAFRAALWCLAQTLPAAAVGPAVCLPPALAAITKAAPPPAATAAAAVIDSKARNGVCVRSSMRGSVDNIAVTIYNPNDEIDSIAEVTSRLSVTGQHAAAGAAAAAAAAAVAAADAGTLRPPPDNLQPGDSTLTIDFGGLHGLVCFMRRLRLDPLLHALEGVEEQQICNLSIMQLCAATMRFLF
jgi:hypothetical protein